MKSTECDVGYVEINGEHTKLLKSVCELDWREFVTTRERRFCALCSLAMFFNNFIHLERWYRIIQNNTNKNKTE